MVMLVAAFAAGLAMPAIPAAAHHSQMVTTVTLSMDDQGTCPHKGCPIDQRAEHGTCVAFSAAPSILTPATSIFYNSFARDILRPRLDRVMADHTIPPDPHPPKQVELI